MKTRAKPEADQPRPLERRIHDHYDLLPMAERKLADVLLEFPGDLAAYSATEFAVRAGVSKAAATRLFRRLGFSSFEEARRLARDSRTRGSPVYLASARRDKADPLNRLPEFAREDGAAIAATLRRLDADTLLAATAALGAARRIVVLGERNSHFIAAYLAGLLGQFRPAVTLAPAPGQTLAEQFADLGGEDVLIAVAMRRRVHGLRRVLELCRRRKCRILLITDPTARGTPAFADWTIACDCATGFVFDSYAAAMSVVRLIAEIAFDRAGKNGRQRMQRIEAALDDLQVLE